MAIISDLKDPRISDVTVTMVEVSPDMRQAKVNVSVMGNETKQQLCVRGLQNSAGYLQQKIGKRIDTRYTPRIKFVLDKGIQHSMTVTRILEEVLPPSETETVRSNAAVEKSGSETDVPRQDSETDNSQQHNTGSSEELPSGPSS